MRLEFGVEFVFTSLLLQRWVRIKLRTAGMVVMVVEGGMWEDLRATYRFVSLK